MNPTDRCNTWQTAHTIQRPTPAVYANIWQRWTCAMRKTQPGPMPSVITLATRLQEGSVTLFPWSSNILNKKMFPLADVTHLCLDFWSGLSIVLTGDMDWVPATSRPSFALKSSLLSRQLAAALALDFESLCGQIHLCHSLSKIVTMQQLPQ